ncbi:M20/M25/M40 family metallo-hydrolase [Agromyces kandeliae]|uniref:M20/M25/M40 family metallo-hydrolase n=1 Tax=Agromyces kandeliae TaxID=2666141 RepID=A0A6L5QXK4_9MICO|nr:M20/M25/M40 family metallo-hydrolase [Agromyces kandeliae]MRX42501.1 M20/M25/M40 family metallo-hydrolase [Agromyces kandeliae]
MSHSPAVRPGAPERLSRMIRLQTVSAEVDRRGFAEFDRFRDLLAELYPLVHEHLAFEPVTELGLLYHWRGRADGDPVVLMAHFDVVPAHDGDGWTFPPFEGRIHDGSVWGRGALDDKGPLLVLLEAVENLLAEGFVPSRDVYLWFGGNEESYGDAAIAAARRFEERGVIPWLVLDEGGAVVDAPLPFLKVPAAMVGVGEKGVMTVRLRARGDGGHASAPPRLTAAARVARAVARLDPNPFPKRMPRSMRAMLASFTPHARGGARLLLSALTALPWLTARVFARLGGEPAALVHTTVAPTMLDGGSAANVLPARASATVNLRVAMGEDVDSVVRRLRRTIRDREVEIEVVEGYAPSPESPTEGPQFAAIVDAVAASYPEATTAPYLMMAATDSRHFHRYAPAVYRFAPLAMSAAQRASVHGVDEHVSIDSLERGERFHRALIRSLPE